MHRYLWNSFLANWLFLRSRLYGYLYNKALGFLERLSFDLELHEALRKYLQNEFDRKLLARRYSFHKSPLWLPFSHNWYRTLCSR